jgi:hypothetical protein
MMLMMALSLAMSPLTMRSAAAMAPAPAVHYEMGEVGHCDKRTQPDQPDQSDADCCIAGCTAVAPLPVPTLPPALLPAVRERPAPDRFLRGFLGEIATPPPRIA